MVQQQFKHWPVHCRVQPPRTRGNRERCIAEGLFGQYVRPCRKQDLSYFGMPSPHRCVQGGCSLWRTRIYFGTVGQQRSAYICMAGPRGPMERGAAGSIKDLEVHAFI